MARWLRGSDIFCFRFALTELPNLLLAYENRRVAYHVLRDGWTDKAENWWDS